jgi:hydroxymethylpyrimidine/phosphomethylpyrimidine kinase
LKKKCVLTIAGSDSSTGAGIQSDLKTFLNHNVYGLTVITSITSQNTLGIRNSYTLPGNVIKKQLEALIHDFKFNVVKTGMLSNEIIVKTLVNILKNINDLKLITDPILYSKNKFKMLSNKGINSLKKDLLPISYLVTPNIPEAEILSGIKINNYDNIKEAALKIAKYGVKNVLIKGGHLSGAEGIMPGTDILYNGKGFMFIKGNFILTKNTHGIGCVLTAAIAANLAKGDPLIAAIKKAKKYINKKLMNAERIGKGYNAVEQ